MQGSSGLGVGSVFSRHRFVFPVFHRAWGEGCEWTSREGEYSNPKKGVHNFTVYSHKVGTST